MTTLTIGFWGGGEGRVYNSVIANKLENFATLAYETPESDKTTKK